DVRLQQAIDGLARGRTTITIAHRLSTAERADRIMVLDHGDLVEHGTHDELVDLDGGIYAGLHRSWVAHRSQRCGLWRADPHRHPLRSPRDQLPARPGSSAPADL